MKKIAKKAVAKKNKVTLESLANMFLGMNAKFEVFGKSLDNLNNKFDNFVEFSTNEFHSSKERDKFLEDNFFKLKWVVEEVESSILHLRASQTKLTERWEKIEDKVVSVPAFAKEIDNLGSSMKSQFTILNTRVKKLEENN